MDEWLKESRRREKLCARTLKGRALLCIDHILSELGDEDPLLLKVYRMAHCATVTCQNPHEDWIKEINETYQKLVDTPQGERRIADGV